MQSNFYASLKQSHADYISLTDTLNQSNITLELLPLQFNEDDHGIDGYIGGKSVDIKIRSAYFNYCPILAEIWSNFELKKKGWALDTTKTNDLILFYWLDNHKVIVIERKPFQDWFIDNWQDIGRGRDNVRCTTTHSNGYYTSVCIPLFLSEIENYIVAL